MIFNHSDLETKKRGVIICKGWDSNGNQRGLRMRPQSVLLCVAVTGCIGPPLSFCSQVWCKRLLLHSTPGLPVIRFVSDHADITASIINCAVRQWPLKWPYNIFHTFITTCLNPGYVIMSDMWHTLYGSRWLFHQASCLPQTSEWSYHQRLSAELECYLVPECVVIFSTLIQNTNSK